MELCCLWSRGNLGFRDCPDEDFIWWNFGSMGWSGIHCVLSDGYPFCPIGLLFVTEYSEICFQRLIGSFRLSICLGMVSGTDVLLYLGFFTNFLRQY